MLQKFLIYGSQILLCKLLAKQNLWYKYVANYVCIHTGSYIAICALFMLLLIIPVFGVANICI